MWVGVRLRPLSAAERARLSDSGGAQWVAGDDGQTLQQALPGSTLPLPGLRPAAFDRVFAPDASGADVGREAVAPLVDAVLRGISCTLLAFGPTGGGKTYSVREACAVVSERLFAAARSGQGRDYVLSLSALEVYDEVRARALLHCVATATPVVVRAACQRR